MEVCGSATTAQQYLNVNVWVSILEIHCIFYRFIELFIINGPKYKWIDRNICPLYYQATEDAAQMRIVMLLSNVVMVEFVKRDCAPQPCQKMPMEIL